jgi:predicted dehydrogenase
MNQLNQVKTAVIGCGAISGIYLTNLKNLFSITDVVAVCDINREAAETAAQKYSIPKAMTVDEALADPEIELCVNLTGPAVHYSMIKQCLEAGKHVYTEKMLCFDIEEGRELLKLADEKRLYLGVAPDTFLGAGLQTARQVIDAGMIGEITSATVAINRNHLLNSEFFRFIKTMGGGLPYDVGIYYLTALLSLLGPVKRVAGFAKTPKQYKATQFKMGNYGESWDFKSSNTMAVSLQFENGVLGNMHFEGESINVERPDITIYGTQGILSLGDPNTFDGFVKLTAANGETCEIPQNYGYSGSPFAGKPENAGLATYGHRGVGVAEMCWAIRENRPNRASKEMGFHGVEVFCGAELASKKGIVYVMTSTFTKPAPLPAGYMDTTFGGKLPIDPEASLIH